MDIDREAKLTSIKWMRGMVAGDPDDTSDPIRVNNRKEFINLLRGRSFYLRFWGNIIFGHGAYGSYPRSINW